MGKSSFFLANTESMDDHVSKPRRPKLCQIGQTLSPSELCSHLIDALGDSVSGSVLDSLEEHRVSGASFLELRDEDLREVASLLGDRVTLRNYIDSFNTSTKVNLNANLKFLVTRKVD